MKLALHLLLSLCMLQVCAQIPSSVNPDHFRKIIRKHYSINCPQAWGADTSKMLGMDLVLRSPKEDTLDQFYENLSVVLQDLRGQKYTLSQMGKESETTIQGLVTELEIMDSRLDSNATHPYYVLNYKGRQGGFLWTTLQRYYLKGPVGYVLSFTLQTGKEEQFIPVANRLFDSFKLLR